MVYKLGGGNGKNSPSNGDGKTTDCESNQGDDSIQQNELFQLLANRRRRLAIRILSSGPTTVELNELSIAVAALEKGVDKSDVSYEMKRNVYQTLKRTHIPQLEQSGLVTYDDESHSITVNDNIHRVCLFITTSDRGRRPWYHYYLYLSVLAFIFLAGTYTNIYPFSLFSVSLIGLAYSLSVLVLSLYYRYWAKKVAIRQVHDRLV